MGHYIAVYDIDTRRGSKVLRTFREFMTWKQNSVFEGELTNSQFKRLEERVGEIIEGEDSVIFYQFRHKGLFERTVLGVASDPSTERFL